MVTDYHGYLSRYWNLIKDYLRRQVQLDATERGVGLPQITFRGPEQKRKGECAEDETRTRMGCPSTVTGYRVYQFHHLGTKLVTNGTDRDP